MTRNPIKITVESGRHCAVNTTQPGHILEGDVEQCLVDMETGVCTTIKGSSANSRYSGLNETLGPRILSSVRNHLKRRVAQVLTGIEQAGLCCRGDEFVGGTLQAHQDGSLEIVRGEDADEACPGAGGAGSDPGGGSGGTPDGSGGDADSGGVECTPHCDSRPFPAYTRKDPHLRTFDGLAYDLQAYGELVLLELPDSAGVGPVHVRQEPLSSELCPHVTLNTAVAARAGGSRVAIYANATVQLAIDGVATPLNPGQTVDLGEGHGLTALGESAWELAWADGSRLRVESDAWRGQHHLDISVLPSGSWVGTVRGLLGDFDGDTDNDFRLRDGALLSQPVSWQEVLRSFGASYRLQQGESLFDYDVGQGPETFWSETLPGAPALPELLPPDHVAEAEAACDAARPASLELERACLLDVICSDGDAGQASWIGRVMPPESTADVVYEEHFVAPHCSTLSPEQYVPIEITGVPVDGSSVTTDSVLEFGRLYRVRAWGTFETDVSGALGDAEYLGLSEFPGGTSDTCGNDIDAGLGIDSAGGAKTTRWGTPCASHAYSLDVVGQGAPLVLTFHDCTLADNFGELRVDLAPERSCSVIERTSVPVVNGGFETSSSHPNNSYLNLATGSSVLTGWTVESGNLDLVGAAYWQHAEGVQSLDMNGVLSATIAQSITTEPGGVYEVSFSIAGNNTQAPAIKVLEVEAAQQSARYNFDVSAYSHANMGWRQASFAFRAVAGATHIRFRSLVSGTAGPALDDVRVNRLVCAGD